jgi:adenine-specific DNA-methyltransferase
MAKSKYESYTHTQLVEEIKKLSKRKKYGLVWEEERTKEKFEAEADGKLPVLVDDKKREIKTDDDKPTHILIEGDNYHALSVLNYTHAKNIDVIYIDPPYNTGAKDWKYNNDYVEKEDSFRHSKWLSFMNNRLKLAKQLLKANGVICVTIDDYEMPRLFMLMEEIFGEENHIGTIVIRNNPSGRSTVKGISITHEYALVFGKTTISKVGRLPRSDKQIQRYDESDSQSAFEWVNFRKHGGTRAESPKMFYPIFLTDSTWRIPKMKWNTTKKEWDLEEQPRKNETIIFPIDDNGKERRWKWAYNTVLENPKEFKIGIDRKKKLAMYLKSRLNNEGVLPLTWWDKKEYSATAYGTNLLKDIFSEIHVFSYPKSLYAVKDCILSMTENKNAIVLDFFAGSGTTAHAVLELNNEDDGNRQCILVTNNENNICTEVCYPRLKKVVEGYKNQKRETVEGLGGNLKYYKTNFVGSEPTHRNKKLLTEKSIDMLCIRENTFEKVLSKADISIFKNKMKYTAILFNEMKMDEFKREIKKLKLPVSIYVFSLEGDDFSDEFEVLKNDITLCSIPEAILKVYRRIYETAKPKK